MTRIIIGWLLTIMSVTELAVLLSLYFEANFIKMAGKI